MTYLDWAATAVPDGEECAAAFRASMDAYANPSSGHAPGKSARELLENSRQTLLRTIGTGGGSRPADFPRLVFTGSGTEADHIPLLSFLRSWGTYGYSARLAPHIILSAIEHAAVWEQAHALSGCGFEVSVVKPDSDGFVRARDIVSALRPSTRVVAVMAVNNETGAVQDTAGIGKAIFDETKAAGMRMPWYHVDCVQALGKLPMPDLAAAKASSAAFSAHKIGAPKGIGALWLSRTLSPLACGGGQEGGIRSGTENLFGALSFAACAKKAEAESESRLARARAIEKKIIDGLAAIPGALPVPFSRRPGDARWSPWIVSAAFPGLGGETMARALSDAGFAVSTGSACSRTHKSKGRRILEAMGIDAEIAFSTIRVSTGPSQDPEDIDSFLETAQDLYRKLKT